MITKQTQKQVQNQNQTKTNINKRHKSQVRQLNQTYNMDKKQNNANKTETSTTKNRESQRKTHLIKEMQAKTHLMVRLEEEASQHEEHNGVDVVLEGKPVTHSEGSHEGTHQHKEDGSWAKDGTGHQHSLLERKGMYVCWKYINE